MKTGNLRATAGVPLKQRLVDPLTGQPATVPGISSAASTKVVTDPPNSDPDPEAGSRRLFDALCSLSVGFSGLDPEACTLDVFGSQSALFGAPFTLANALTIAISGGQPLAGDVFQGLAEGLAGGIPLDRAAIKAETVTEIGTSLVPLNADPNDNSGASIPAVPALDSRLTDEQEALLGCGPFYGTSCDADGLDLFYAEVGALLLAFPAGAHGRTLSNWIATDAAHAQPGTPDFDGPPACRRKTGEATVVLPGCRGPGHGGYQPFVDGTVSGVVHPFTGQTFKSELAALSWNLLMLHVITSGEPPTDFDGSGLPDNDEDGDGEVDSDVFDPSDPMREDGCSFAHPGSCGEVQDLLSMAVLELEGDPDGPPRRRWLWQSGSMHPVSSAAGTESDFVDWTLYLAGPEPARVPGDPLGAWLFLVPPAPPLDSTPASALSYIGTPGMDGIAGTGDEAVIGAAYVTGSPRSQFLSFPLDVECDGRPCTAFTARMSSVLDYHGTPIDPASTLDWYVDDGTVEAYTGETARRANGEICSPEKAPSYKNDSSTPFVVNGNYVGASSCSIPKQFLNYDGHPGYDYAYGGVPILAPADGELSKAEEDTVNGRGRGEHRKPSAWEKWHTFYIEHDNGYTTWYLHAANLTEDISEALGEDLETSVEVDREQQIAITGGFGGVSPHLHFEVRCGMHEMVDPYSENVWLAPEPNSLVLSVTALVSLFFVQRVRFPRGDKLDSSFSFDPPWRYSRPRRQLAPHRG